MIQPVESLEITVLVDNETDSLSSNPGFVETEMAGGADTGTFRIVPLRQDKLRKGGEVHL